MDSSKRVITLKTINKLCKTSSKKKAKCKHLVTHPSRFLDPYTFHRFLSDMIIPDKLSCVSEDYLSLNALLAPTKHIFAIEEKGTSYQMNVVEKNVYKTLPVGMLSYRLRSLGDEAAYFLAQVLDEFVEIFSLIEMIRSVGHMKQVLDQIKIQNIKKILSYFDEIHRKAMSKEEWEKWREEWMEKKKNDLTYYVTYGSFKGHEGGSKIESIGINQTFQKLIGIDPFKIMEEEPFLIPFQDFYSVCGLIIKTMMHHSFFSEKKFLIRTLLGIRTINFKCEKMYYYDSGQLKIVTFLYSEFDYLDEDIKAFLKKDAKSELKESFQKNEFWKKITEIYYKKLDGNLKIHN